MNKPLDRNQTTMNHEHRSLDTNRPTGRRRHLTTPNRIADLPIPEEPTCSSSQQLKNDQFLFNNSQANKSESINNKAHCCCCHSSQPIVLCSTTHYHGLPDLIIQHQPLIMSADVHFESQQPINQVPIDKLAAFVYTPQWIENDVFLPGNQAQCNFATMNNTSNQVSNNQAVNQVHNLLNNHTNNKQTTQNNLHQQQSNNKVDFYSPRIVRCQLTNSALYQYNQRLNAKIMLNNARKSASVSLPIDHETLRQVGYSLRMISEQFHLQRLQANALKNQEKSNFSHLIRWFCKLVVNKLPSISWKAQDASTMDDKQRVESRANCYQLLDTFCDYG